MGCIRLLPDLLISQIAAGEVVERPASALKELLENSLDAGSREIRVDLEEGGIKLIRVADDGIGIDAGDLANALARHATSKITSLAELESVASLGFRGEALASIAAIARVALTSRAGAAGHAWRIGAQDGTLTATEPAALSIGTVVEVRDLFFNTPVRRKFLRTQATEYGHCEEAMRRAALARPEVTFELRHNGRVAWRCPAQDVVARVTALLGDDFAAAARRVDQSAGELRLHGLAGLPAYSRSGRDAQYLFVNGRYVRDKLLGHALREATAISCTTTVIRPMRCILNCRPNRSMSMSTPPRPRSAFVSLNPCTSLFFMSLNGRWDGHPPFHSQARLRALRRCCQIPPIARPAIQALTPHGRSKPRRSEPPSHGPITAWWSMPWRTRRHKPSPCHPLAMPSARSLASMSWQRTQMVWWWWICMPPTSASCMRA